MEVSSNWGTRKSSILHDFTGFSINDPAIGVPPFMEQRSQVQPRVPLPPAAGARDGKRRDLEEPEEPEDLGAASTRRGELRR